MRNKDVKNGINKGYKVLKYNQLEVLLNDLPSKVTQTFVLIHVLTPKALIFNYFVHN